MTTHNTSVKELEKLLLDNGFKIVSQKGTHRKYAKGIHRFILTAKGGGRPVDPMQIKDLKKLLNKIKQEEICQEKLVLK